MKLIFWISPSLPPFLRNPRLHNWCNITLYWRIAYPVPVLVPTEARCTFESGFCGWQNTSEEMSLTWKLYKGDRQKFTGPKWDNTYQNRTGKRRRFQAHRNFLVFGFKTFSFFPVHRYVRLCGHVRTGVSGVGGPHGKHTLSPAAAVLFRPGVQILQFVLRKYIDGVRDVWRENEEPARQWRVIRDIFPKKKKNITYYVT